MSTPVSFEAWKKLLLNDCVALGKLREYHDLGESVLQLLYDSGLDPTVKAITIDSEPETA